MPGLLDPFGGADPSSLLGDPQQQGLLGFLAGLQKSGALDYTAPFLSGKVPGGFAAGLAGGAGGLLAARDAYANRAKSLAETQLVGAQIPKVQAEAAYLKGKTDFATQLMGLLGGGRSAAPGSAAPAPADSIFSPPAPEEPETASPASAAPSAPLLPIKPAIAPGTDLGIGGAVGGGGSGYPFPNLGANSIFPALPPNTTDNPGVAGPGVPTNPTPLGAAPAGSLIPGRWNTASQAAAPASTAGLLAAAGGGQLPASPLVRAAQAAQAAPAPSAPTPAMGSGLNLRNLPPEVLFGMAGDIMGFPSLGQLLTGTPSYKGAVKGAETGAERAITEPSDTRLKQTQAELDRETKRQEQTRGAALDMTTITVSDGRGGLKKIPATREQAVRASRGEGVPELGIPGLRPGSSASAAQPGGALGEPVFTPGQTKGLEGIAAAGVKALDDTHQAELVANKRTQTLGQMAEAMQGFTPGATAELQLRAKRILKDLGAISGENVPPAEIFQQAGKHLQITAQPKGQGSISNFERDLFAQAVPNMTNSPEGLIKAIGIAKRLDDYDRAVAQIHRDVAKDNGGLPNYIEAQQRIAKLGPPLSPSETAALESVKGGPRAAGGAAPRSGVTSSGVKWSIQ